jgi:hypothetical protein
MLLRERAKIPLKPVFLACHRRLHLLVLRYEPSCVTIYPPSNHVLAPTVMDYLPIIFVAINALFLP